MFRHRSFWEVVLACVAFTSTSCSNTTFSPESNQASVNSTHVMPSVVDPSDLSPEWEQLFLAGREGEEVTVLSGNELIIRGVRCRLLGIRLLENGDKARDAKLFLSRYMDNFGGYFGIWNDQDPVNDTDGVPLIWLYGHSNEGFAQEGLVRTGLAMLQFDNLDEYQFHVDGNDGSWSEFNWRQSLEEAEEDWKSGKKATYRFGWPPSDDDAAVPMTENATKVE